MTNVGFQAGMAKMAPGIFFLDTDHVDAPFQENIKSLTGVPFIVIPITSDAAKGFNGAYAGSYGQSVGASYKQEACADVCCVSVMVHTATIMSVIRFLYV